MPQERSVIKEMSTNTSPLNVIGQERSVIKEQSTKCELCGRQKIDEKDNSKKVKILSVSHKKKPILLNVC